MELGLEGRICLITGGSSGIGLQVARDLQEAGAQVAICARDRDRLEAARAGLGPGALAVIADLGDPTGADTAVRATVARFGGLDVLDNTLAVAQIGRWDEVPDEQWDAAWQLNVMSYLRAARSALPYLRASSQARIVNVSSTSGKRPSASMPEYSVTKAAVLSLSRLLADELAADGILVNAVCPGPTLTPIWLGEGGLADQTAARSGTGREAVLTAVGKGRPLGRLGESGEIAGVIALLCSARASYVTGAAWNVDGGTVQGII